jgi:H+/Cl- antiporter ClcA
MIWLLLRACFVLAPIGGVFFHQDTSRAPEWQALVLVPIAFAIAVFAWLSFLGRRKTVDFEQPFSMTLPFYPFDRYPVRFWLLCGIVAVTAGISRILASLFSQQRLTGGSMFLFIGLGILVAVFGWMQWHKRKIPT